MLKLYHFDRTYTETEENEFKLATLNILKGNYTFSPARVMARLGNLSTTDQCSNL